MKSQKITYVFSQMIIKLKFQDPFLEVDLKRNNKTKKIDNNTIECRGTKVTTGNDTIKLFLNTRHSNFHQNIPNRKPRHPRILLTDNSRTHMITWHILLLQTRDGKYRNYT